MMEKSSVLLSVQRALLGAVPSGLRAVACGWDGTMITLRFIFDGPISPHEEQEMYVVGTEVVADFRSPATIEEQIIRVDSPQGISEYALKAWAYMRKEPSDDVHSP